jgi:ACR3 family arsenite transporter
MRSVLSRLEDFRLLPLFVVASMAIGIAVGNALRISDFALTPPIDAIKDIAGGTFELSVPNAISLGVPIGLFAMMYPAMTNVRLGEVGAAFRSPRQLALVLAFNYLVAPFLMVGLANLFVADPELRTGERLNAEPRDLKNDAVGEHYPAVGRRSGHAYAQAGPGNGSSTG